MKCPRCESPVSWEVDGKTRFDCGSFSHDGSHYPSDTCKSGWARILIFRILGLLDYGSSDQLEAWEKSASEYLET